MTDYTIVIKRKERTMVQTLERIETQVPEVAPQRTVKEVGEQLGIPISIRPWWGSRRTTRTMYHRECGGVIYPWGECSVCRRNPGPDEIERHWSGERRWICAAGYNSTQIKWPEIQSGTVVMWEGQCGYVWDRYRNRGHKHRQTLEVLDVGETAFLLKVLMGWISLHFLIGMDDDHPFVTTIPKRNMTVQDAFDWLVPNIVREALVLGLNVKRQGDWYFIPTDREPKLHKRGCRVHAATPSLQNNRLYRGAPLVWNRQTNHTGGLVVYQTVQKMPYTIPFVRGNVRAPDHPTLHLKSWHMAIRSRSTSAGSSDGPTLD